LEVYATEEVVFGICHVEGFLLGRVSKSLRPEERRLGIPAIPPSLVARSNNIQHLAIGAQDNDTIVIGVAQKEPFSGFIDGYLARKEE
jgi:hypothetical protein